VLPNQETWIAPDGTSVTIRPIRAADFDLEREFVDKLSSATGYQRLMSTRQLSADEIKRFTDIDYRREMALIATVVVDSRERQIGVARYVREADTPAQAEFAIVLADDWQGRGLGSKLLSSLLAVARREGLRRIFGIALSTNRGMLALASRMGFRLAPDPSSATITTLTLDLT
jgi:RimJ/RimL family protein N-acetyltransferase